jgi:hypothetical protein
LAGFRVRVKLSLSDFGPEYPENGFCVRSDFVTIGEATEFHWCSFNIDLNIVDDLSFIIIYLFIYLYVKNYAFGLSFPQQGVSKRVL